MKKLLLIASILTFTYSLAQEKISEQGSENPIAPLVESSKDKELRLNSNIVREKTGDVYIRPFLKDNDGEVILDGSDQVMAFYAYIDPVIDKESYIKFFNGSLRLNWANLVPIMEQYFKKKRITFKPIPKSESTFKKYFEKGIPISFFIELNPSDMADADALFSAYLSERNAAESVEELKKITTKFPISDLTKLLNKAKKEHLVNPRFALLLGYNATTKEIYFSFCETGAVFWLPWKAFEKIPVSKLPPYTFRSFDL